MWSAANQEYVAALIETYHKEYPYYMAHTVSDSLSNVSIMVYLSNEPIISGTAYSYTVPAESICISIISAGYSSYGTSNASPRMSLAAFSGSVSVPVYEFIYTNADYAEAQQLVQPDIRNLKGGSQNDSFQALGICCCCCLLFCVFCSFFRR